MPPQLERLLPDAPALPLDLWEGRTSGDLAAHWQLPRVVLLRAVGSTNDFARALAADGAPAGTVVLAEEQFAGRGRSGRRWESPPGLGLYISLVARPDASVLPTYPLRAALAIAAALDPCTRGRVAIKWPNDLLLDGRKFGGILCEASWSGGTFDSAVIGIGLNVLHTSEDFPPELRDTATSIRAAVGDVSRFEVATAVVRRIASLAQDRAGPDGTLDPDLVAELNQRHAYRGEQVDVIEPDSGRVLLSGRAEEIAADGSLTIRDGQALHSIRTGTLRLSRAHPD